MVLSGSRRAATDFLADNPVTGDTVCHSNGMIGSATPVSLTVDAYADNGWSGGHVVNRRGRLVGVITQGVGNTIKRPEAMSTQRLHDFVVGNNLPGLLVAVIVGPDICSKAFRAVVLVSLFTRVPTCGIRILKNQGRFQKSPSMGKWCGKRY